MAENKDVKEVYRLKITRPYQVSVRKIANPSVHFDWENKEDALAAKALLEKAVSSWPNGVRVEFVVHTPDFPLEG